MTPNPRSQVRRERDEHRSNDPTRTRTVTVNFLPGSRGRVKRHEPNCSLK
jgi:hypothetical protein